MPRLPQSVRWRLKRLATSPSVGPRGAWLAARRRPVSKQYGFDRGTPVDRVYIEAFLSRYADDISGRVLEVGDDSYTRRFGGSSVLSADVLDPIASNPRTTLVGRLDEPSTLPRERFDCIICTQTLLLIYELRIAVTEMHRALAPGGAVLLTVPGVSRISRPEDELWGDYWRFTCRSLRRLLEECFPAGAITVEAYGNIRTATAMLYGLAAEELPPRTLHQHDRDYEVVVAARARKPC